MIARDPLGARAVYFDAEGHAGERARPLATGEARLDRDGVLHAWGEGGRSEHSVLAGVFRLPPGHRLNGTRVEAVPLPAPPPSLESALVQSLEPLVRPGAECALWLSGGLDSALLLVLLQELGVTPRAYIFQPAFAHAYDESAAALRLARAFSIAATVVRVSAADFVRALPACVSACEAPLWNLHPLQKRVLAERTRADGFARAITGDGADEAFAPAYADDYLPLVTAIARDAGVTVQSPFFDARFVAWARAQPPDPRKKALRALARTRLPEDLVQREKQRALAPPLDVSRFLDGNRAARLATALALPAPRGAGDVKWASLCLLARAWDIAAGDETLQPRALAGRRR